MKKLITIIFVFATGIFLFFKTAGKRINNIQVIGSHNSYKEYIDSPLFSLISKEDPNAIGLAYSNKSLTHQLSLGLRSLEIDIYADTKGGKYANPGGLEWAGKNPGRPYDPNGLMKQPGFKIMHIQDIDFRSNCLTLNNCLQELKTWSGAHPNHEPVYITMNAKDDTIAKPGFTIPEKFTAGLLNKLDEVIMAQLGAGKLITPDMVRGEYSTLEKAVLKNNWPRLKDATGKFIFILDEEGDKRAAYIDNHPSLRGRVLFTNSPDGTPEAAIIIMNDPVKNLSKIQQLVRLGYIVRTRADADTREARTNDATRFLSACKSGAQIISTDYYERSNLFISPYQVCFDEGIYIRKNPVLE